MMAMLPQELLTEANEAQQRQIEELRAELYMRAAARPSEMMTALGALAATAERGNQQAKQLLSDFFATWERARAAASGIVVATPAVKPEFEAPTHPEGWSSNPG